MDYEIVRQSSFFLYEKQTFIKSKKHTHQKYVQNITKHCTCSEMFQTKNTHTIVRFKIRAPAKKDRERDFYPHPI